MEFACRDGESAQEMSVSVAGVAEIQTGRLGRYR